MKTTLFMIALCLFSYSFSATEPTKPSPAKEKTTKPKSSSLMYQTADIPVLYDAYQQGGTGTIYKTATNVRVEKDNRVAYLMFDLSSISGTISDVKLHFTVDTDTGSGSVNFNKGSRTDWSETNLTNTNKPLAQDLLGNLNTTYAPLNTEFIVDLDHTLLPSGLLAVVITQIVKPTGGDFDFASKQHATKAPAKLVVTYTTGGGDTQAPNVPTNLAVSNVNTTSADVSWNATTDNGGGSVAGYYVYNNGTQIANSTGTGTSLSLTNLTEQTAYQLSIAAYDNAATPNVSAQSSPTVDFTTLSSVGGTGGFWTQTANNDLNYTTGNVGIGTTNIGTWHLAVGGKIRAEEIKVETGWADYVFTDEYKLPTLEEVEKHINEKGHLINIPSAEEVEANGILLGQMNKLLLEKIEELTLYIIQQDKTIDNLQDRVSKLESN